MGSKYICRYHRNNPVESSQLQTHSSAQAEVKRPKPREECKHPDCKAGIKDGACIYHGKRCAVDGCKKRVGSKHMCKYHRNNPVESSQSLTNSSTESGVDLIGASETAAQLSLSKKARGKAKCNVTFTPAEAVAALNAERASRNASKTATANIQHQLILSPKAQGKAKCNVTFTSAQAVAALNAERASRNASETAAANIQRQLDLSPKAHRKANSNVIFTPAQAVAALNAERGPNNKDAHQSNDSTTPKCLSSAFTPAELIAALKSENLQFEAFCDTIQ